MPRRQKQKQAQQQAAHGLLALPEPVLVAVLQCLAAADDQHSLFSAARAHSRLHQAAVAALDSIAVMEVEQQQRLDGVSLYLRKHGQHVRSLSLGGVPVMHKNPPVVQLPATLQLHSLELENLRVQLLPGITWQGVLGQAAGAAALTQLRLSGCKLLDGQEEGLVAALAQLPSTLQHLSVCDVKNSSGKPVARLPQIVLQQAPQQLTYLELLGDLRRGADKASPALQPLQALSRLADLRLSTYHGKTAVLTASMLPGATGLTCLELQNMTMEPGALAGKMQLQHLELTSCDLAAGAAATAYSALTASSTLQHLWLQGCTLQAGVWPHMFPVGRQLPHLTLLVAYDLWQPSGRAIAAPRGSLLASCCPGLRHLDVQGLSYSPGLFSSLRGLSGLHTLLVTTDSREELQEVCQLTGLQDLYVNAAEGDVELLLQTTQLRHLTSLDYYGEYDGDVDNWTWMCQAPGDEPVWRQVLRHHLDHSDPAVAEAAAAALEAE